MLWFIIWQFVIGYLLFKFWCEHIFFLSLRGIFYTPIQQNRQRKNITKITINRSYAPYSTTVGIKHNVPELHSNIQRAVNYTPYHTVTGSKRNTPALHRDILIFFRVEKKECFNVWFFTYYIFIHCEYMG